MLKKWILIVCCFWSTFAVADSLNDNEELMRVLQSPKAEKLNRKVTQFYLTHPKTSAYLYEGGRELATIFENYYDRALFLVEQYPNDRITQQLETRLAGIREMLDQREFLVKVGLFLAFGIYDLNSYQDAKSWKDLLATQTAIFNADIRELTLKREVKKGLKDPEDLETYEKDLVETIRAFCQKSKDPFFHQSMLSLIEGCDSREGVLKHYKISQSEMEMEDIDSEAELKFMAFNQAFMEELKVAVKKYFSAESIAEQFIEMTSDTFDLPTIPAHLRVCTKGCCKQSGEEEEHHSP